jgi:hypothetical protein
MYEDLRSCQYEAFRTSAVQQKSPFLGLSAQSGRGGRIFRRRTIEARVGGQLIVAPHRFVLVPTDGSMPASANRSVYRIDRYWLPRAL